jgi:type I restriction enzyme R subunit
MTTELQACQPIDRQLAACGWAVQGRRGMNIYAASGVAVREFPLDSGEADYLLYADGKVIGVVEAKAEGHGTLSGVECQSARYVGSLPAGVPAHRLPVPFHYEATGALTQVTSLLGPLDHSAKGRVRHRPAFSFPSGAGSPAATSRPKRMAGSRLVRGYSARNAATNVTHP